MEITTSRRNYLLGGGIVGIRSPIGNKPLKVYQRRPKTIKQ